MSARCRSCEGPMEWSVSTSGGRLPLDPGVLERAPAPKDVVLHVRSLKAKVISQADIGLGRRRAVAGGAGVRAAGVALGDVRRRGELPQRRGQREAGAAGVVTRAGRERSLDLGERSVYAPRAIHHNDEGFQHGT